MRIIASLVSCLLTLAGCNEKPSTTSVVRSLADGVELIHSQTTIRGGVARFRCIESASGQCHYAVFGEECPPLADLTGSSGKCTPRKLHAFVVAAGAEAELQDLPRKARSCVDREREPTAEECLR